MVHEDDPKRARRAAIADAAIGILSRQGTRGLTHRAVDRSAGIPQGSTSYYASTRRALLELIVEDLAARSIADAERADTAVRSALGVAGRDVAGLGPAIAGLIDALAARPDDMRARYALLLELDAADPLRVTLAGASPVQDRARPLVAAILDAHGVAEPESHAGDVVDLVDALLARRIVTGDSRSTERIVAGFLRGLPRAPLGDG